MLLFLNSMDCRAVSLQLLSLLLMLVSRVCLRTHHAVIFYAADILGQWFEQLEDRLRCKNVL